MKNGFTLIELLVVIAIIGILSAIGINNFMSARIKAIDAQKKSDLQTISKSLEAYANDHQTYPLSDGNGRIICQPTQNPNYCDWNTAFTDGTSTYTPKLPIDPNGYLYIYSSAGKNFTIYAHLNNADDPQINSSVVSQNISCGSSVICNYKLTSTNTK
jgi:type II secretion system protein G